MSKKSILKTQKGIAKIRCESYPIDYWKSQLSQGVMTSRHPQECACHGIGYRYWWLWKECPPPEYLPDAVCRLQRQHYETNRRYTERYTEQDWLNHCWCLGTGFVPNITLESLLRVTREEGWEVRFPVTGGVSLVWDENPFKKLKVNVPRDEPLEALTRVLGKVIK